MKTQMTLIDGLNAPKEKTTQTCRICNIEKEITEFALNRTIASFGKIRKDYKYYCKLCKNNETRIANKLHKLNKKPEPGTCQICQRHTIKWVLDHDHETKQFRGWLCNDCNTSLGKWNDNVNILQNAINYLNKNKNRQ